MNYKMVFGILGKTMLIEAVLMLFPMLVGIIAEENTYLNFLIPVGILLVTGIPMSLLKSRDKYIYAKEGFVIVALAWIVLSLVGALPFVIGGEIPNYADAFFETVSGFTTTGASILDDVTVLSQSAAFWRILTHFIGGMGVLVFVLCLLPDNGAGAMHLFRAESPGPSASKFVSRMKRTARILYGIYIAMTLAEALLLFAGGLNFYESLLNAFSTAGTGGFALHNGSIAYYNSAYIEIVIAVFMMLFAINFNVFYLILTGSVIKALKSEELRVYLSIVVGATLVIALNLLYTYEKISTFSSALRYSYFQVASISSTTGFTTDDFYKWPALSKAVLLFLTIVGACGGSTGGGLKVSRLIILVKSAFADLTRTANPRAVLSVKLEGESLSKETERSVKTYFVLFIIIVSVTTLLVSIEGSGDLFDNFAASLACIGNVGPALTKFAFGSFSGYSAFSKVIFSIAMLAGRLEILPILLLFAPRTWKRS